jgi:hypothetical protein
VNASICAGRHTRTVRGRAPACRNAAAAVVATAVLCLSACSGAASSAGGSPSAGGSSGSQSAIGFSHCMRAHRLPSYPDPDSSGNLPKTDAQQLGVSTSQYDAARQACRHLLPSGGSLQEREDRCIQNSDCPQALVQRMLVADRKFAQCMRSHGVPNFPDPTADSDGPVFDISKAGISDAESHTHQFEATLDECERLVGGNAPYQFG